MDPEDKKYPAKNTVSSFPLALADAGETVRIVFIRGGANLKERLLSMGLRVDDIVEIVQCREKGAVLVAKDENRFMLGGGMAQKIFVKKERGNGKHTCRSCRRDAWPGNRFWKRV